MATGKRKKWIHPRSREAGFQTREQQERIRAEALAVQERFVGIKKLRLMGDFTLEELAALQRKLEGWVRDGHGRHA